MYSNYKYLPVNLVFQCNTTITYIFILHTLNTCPKCAEGKAPCTHKSHVI